MNDTDWKTRIRAAITIDPQKLEDRARGAGRWMTNQWERSKRLLSDIAQLPSHEDRIRKVEKDTKELAEDILSIKRWLQDIDNRTKLLEHYQNYDLDDVNCPICRSPMRVKRNRHNRTFFFGCSNYSNGCRGTRPISEPHLVELKRRYDRS